MNELTESSKKSDWSRLPYMILFAILFNISEFVIYVIMIIQFVLKLMTGEGNDRLFVLGKNIARYVTKLVEYLTFVSDEKPYPFSSWPADENIQAIGGIYIN